MPDEPDPQHGPPDFSSDHPVPPKLIKFRNLTGINTPKNLLDAGFARPGKNIGIYARVIAEEYKISWQYWFMSALIEGSFLGQVAIGAALTALGASNSSHIAITILGSANTVIAGLQTYLKGQGLPNRLQQYEFGLRKLREHIEDLERHFSHEECRLNVDHEIAEVAAMYHAVRQTAEDNTPDTYLPMSGAGASLLARARATKSGSTPPPAKPVASTAASGAAAPSSQPPAPAVETAPEALAASGKPPTADEVAEAGGPEASKPAPAVEAAKDGTKDKAEENLPKDADVTTTNKDGTGAAAAEPTDEQPAGPPENSDEKKPDNTGSPSAGNEASIPSGPNEEEHADADAANEETPLLKKT